MKTHVWKSEFSVLSSSLRRLLLSILMVVISSRAYGQSSALTECTRAFYRGDYALAVQLAEKHLRKYPKDVPVRVALARAELAQVKPLRSFEGHSNPIREALTPFIICLLLPKSFHKANISGYFPWLRIPSVYTNSSGKRL